MTEQERPRTRRALDRFMEVLEARTALEPRHMTAIRASLRAYRRAIEEAARTEGRQQAVREIERVIRDELMMASDDTGSDQFEQGALAAYNHVLGSLPVGVAGLNASETMHDAFCILSRDHGGACDIPGLNASESPPTGINPERLARAIYNVEDGMRDDDPLYRADEALDRAAEYMAEYDKLGDASESGQPPEASDE